MYGYDLVIYGFIFFILAISIWGFCIYAIEKKIDYLHESQQKKKWEVIVTATVALIMIVSTVITVVCFA